MDVHVRLSAQAKEKIRSLAEQEGITIQEYIRRALSRKSDIVVDIAVHDLHDYIAATDSLVQTVNGILSVLTRSGKVYQQDIDRIKELLKEIVDKMAEMYRMEVSDRRQLYMEARKRVFDDINTARIPKRRRR